MKSIEEDYHEESCSYVSMLVWGSIKYSVSVKVKFSRCYEDSDSVFALYYLISTTGGKKRMFFLMAHNIRHSH